MKERIAGALLAIGTSLLALSSQHPESVLKGEYLGQKPPGKTPELFAPGVLSTGSHELDITLSPGLDEIYFTRTGPDFFSSIIRFHRVDGTWRGPEIPAFVGENGANYPFVTPDGKKIYFETKGMLPGKNEAAEFVAVVDRTESGWSAVKPVHVAGEESRMMFLSVSRSGNLYFSSNRKGGWGGFDLYKSDIAPDGSLRPENLGPDVNSEANEFHAFIAPDESFLIFDAMNRPGGFGRNDLYVSFRKEDGTWTKAENLGAEVNTEASDMRPYVSPDGKYLFFCSDRSAAQTRPAGTKMDYRRFMDRINGPGNGSQDIYWMEATIIARVKARRP